MKSITVEESIPHEDLRDIYYPLAKAVYQARRRVLESQGIPKGAPGNKENNQPSCRKAKLFLRNTATSPTDQPLSLTEGTEATEFTNLVRQGNSIHIKGFLGEQDCTGIVDGKLQCVFTFRFKPPADQDQGDSKMHLSAKAEPNAVFEGTASAGAVPEVIEAASTSTKGPAGTAAIAGTAITGKNSSNTIRSQAISHLQMLSAGTDSQMGEAARALGDLAQKKTHITLVREIGSIPPLVELMRTGIDVQTENASRALGYLARNDHKASIPLLCAAGAIELFVNLISTTKAWNSHYSAARALADIACDATARQNIYRAGGIKHLVQMLSVGAADHKDMAAFAIGNLADEWTSEHVCAQGAIQPLVALARDGTDDQKENAARALAYLAPHSKAAICAVDGIQPLVTLCSGTAGQQYRAVCALQKLCQQNKSAAVDESTAGMICSLGVTPALETMAQSSTDDDLKEHAEDLLKILEHIYPSSEVPFLHNLCSHRALVAG